MEAFRPRRHDQVQPLDLAAFAASLQGELIVPSSETYDEVRQVRNAHYDKRPALIVRAAGATDVARPSRSPPTRGCRWRSAAAATAWPATARSTAASSST